jgi:hypothetical protein
VLLISRGRRRWPGRWSRPPARDWTHLENGSLAFSAAFRRHAIEPSINEDHVVDRFRAVVIICLPTETVKALVVVTIGIDHEDSAQVIVAAVWKFDGVGVGVAVGVGVGVAGLNEKMTPSPSSPPAAVMP